jgi:hypothetical protein
MLYCTCGHAHHSVHSVLSIVCIVYVVLYLQAAAMPIIVCIVYEYSVHSV